MANERGYDVALTVGGGTSGDVPTPAPSGPQSFHYEATLPNGTTFTHNSPTQLTEPEWRQLVQDHFADTLQKSQPTSWQDIMSGVRNTVLPFGAEMGGMMAGASAGAGIGGTIGAMGGPLAPATIPIGALLGGVIGGGIGYAGGRNAGKAGQVGMDALNSGMGGGLYGPGVQYPNPLGKTLDLGEFVNTLGEGAQAESTGRILGPLGAGVAKSRGGLRPSEFIPAVKRGFGVPDVPTTPLQMARERSRDVRELAAGLPRANVETGELLSSTPGTTGVDLTAAQQTGRPFFQWAENYAGKSPMGRDKMMAFAERQTEQLQQAGAALQAQASGLPPMDALTRNNRFVNVMRGQLAATKAEGNRLFDVAYDAIGPKTPVNANNLIGTAKAIASEQPTIRGQQVKGFGLGPVDDVIKQVVGRDTDAEIRALLKLGPTDPIPPGIQISGGAPQKAITLNEMRILKNRLVDIAFPDRFAGAAVVDSAQVRTARRLIAAIGDDIDAVAASKGPGAVAALQDAKQFWGTQVHGMDARWYADVLADKRVLSDMNTRLFNRNDPGVLLDAKKVTSPEGWQLIQQQYMDMIFKDSTFVRPETGGSMGFNGKRFAERILNPREQVILNTLYPPDVVKNITDFAKIAQVASPTSAMMSSQVAGLWLGTGQVVAATIGGMHAVRQAAGGDIPGALVSAAGSTLPYVAPLGMAKVFTNPTATYYLVRAMEAGTLSPETYAQIIRTVTEGTSVVRLGDNYTPQSNRRLQLNVPPSQLVTQPPGMRGIQQTPDSLVRRY